MIEVVVFDLDDTLYLERDFVRSGFRAVDRWVGEHLAREGFFERAWEHFVAGQRGNIFDLVLPALGIAPEADLVRRLVEVYRAHEPAIELEPEARDLLAWLAGRRPLALLTDGYHATQRRKVAALGLARHCRPIVYTDALGRAHWKPSPEGFLAIQAHFDLAPECFVYIGDNPAKDFRAPKALGWRTIRVRHPLGEHARSSAASAADEADHTITGLAEIGSRQLLEAGRR